jgi:hypothetical protein
MPDVQPPVRPARAAREDHAAREKARSRIGGQVLSLLGHPAGRVAQVCPLWGNFYRVNVLTPEPLGSVRIPGSYFLEVDSDGNIITSDPVINRPG